MERRKFIIGLGSLAAGGAAATGSGAFSAMSAGRDANINVKTDENGLIALEDDTPSDVVREKNGQFLIDFSSDGGVNIDSIYQVGKFIQYPPHPSDVSMNFTEFARQHGGGLATPVYEEPAFLIQNNDSVEHDVTLSFKFNSHVDGARAYFQVQTEEDGTAPVAGSGNTNGDLSGDILATDTTEVSTTINLSSGEAAGVSFALSTIRCTNTGDISATLTVSAE
jgi:hypothetical protein